MQEKGKEKPRRTWRGFEAEDSTRYTITLVGERIAVTEERVGETPINEVIMAVTDFKQLMAMGQDLLFEAGDGVMRSPGDTGTPRG